MTILSTVLAFPGKGTPELISKFSTLDISAPLAESLPACGALWWFARWTDRKGCGRAEFDIQSAASLLGKSYVTVRGYIRSCLKRGLFRSAIVRGGRAVVYYVSLVKVAAMRGLESLGAFGQISVQDLANLRFVATEIQTEALQRQSRYAAIEAEKTRLKTNRVEVAKPEDIFDGPSLNSQGGHTPDLIFVGPRCAFVSEEFTVFGAPQVAIADGLNRTERTIRRRLSNQYRSERGIQPILKKQIAQRQSCPVKDWDVVSRNWFDIGEPNVGSEYSRYFNQKASDRWVLTDGGQVKSLSRIKCVFRADVNVYLTAVELKGKRHLKKQFSKAINKGHD